MAGRGRSGADELLASELAAGRTIKDAATAAGVSERTAARRLEEPAFRARVTELRDAMVSLAAGRLADGMANAADVLAKLLTHQKPDVRLRAAVKILEHGVKVADVAELQRRMDEFERRAAAREKRV